MKKAFAWLEGNGIEYRFHDYKKSGVPADKVHVVPNGAQAADLRELLRLAVDTVNFQLAAELRDRLRVLE